MVSVGSIALTTTPNLTKIPPEGAPILPPIDDAAKLISADLPEPPVIIENILHAGGKLVMGGGSKSFKTWTLIDLAISVAYGEDWWGQPTNPARVLYVNLEIQRAFFARRLRNIAEKRGITINEGDLPVWNLRGYAADMKLLVSRISQAIKEKDAKLVIIDPIYKCLGERDENSAGDIAALMNELERIAVESGAAVVFGAHFSKGNQAGKESIDRIGGSGVFARDPDSILVLTPHEEENAFTVDATLRNFPQLAPFCVRWDYPILRRDNDLDPAALKRPRKGAKRAAPIPDHVISAFPKNWPADNPRKGLLSSSELADWCVKEGYDKTGVKACRDSLEKAGHIRVLSGLPKNQVLAGIPRAVRAFEEHQKEIQEGKPARKRKARAQRNQFSSSPGELN